MRLVLLDLAAKGLLLDALPPQRNKVVDIQRNQPGRRSFQKICPDRRGMYSTALSGVQGLLPPDTDWVYAKKPLGGLVF